ncbi:ATP-binding cassette domain-containing protein [Muricauda sp. 2012CJ35-5]|uniref:ATP-binding cassette domain-containing protein n=1 Tax=Flagellimonas spongiicola TaxID=2942208 RepID=A0ABT0PPL1_9FLAO|nr:ATP-binding cassette domain-containing protein [Allomuricauda spongiicola]MCL6273156.1 ATP-binding cassette domain-containing protein [Allomuricauda spongiicola]
MIAFQVRKSLEGPNGLLNLDLNIQIEAGDLVTLYGASGAGKTSALRILAGLMKANSGRIVVDGSIWLDTSNKIDMKPQERQVGFVFQDYALFPHLTALQNLEFASTDSTNKSQIAELVEIMELEKIQNRKPATLSGGQRQRLALARSIVQRPKILLLDEPLAALDITMRLKIQTYLKKVHERYNLTTILVSHDIGEIHKLSNRVYVLEEGKVVKQGTPTEVFFNQKLSGKFKFKGNVLKIEKEDVVYVVTVLIHNEMVKVIAQESEIKNLNVGDVVLVASKAFNPIIQKIK